MGDVRDSLACFKAYDIRGRIPDELNEDLVYDIARAYAVFLEPRKVAVGRDIRLSSAGMSEALCRGLNDAGVDVIDIGLCGTEEVYFATSHLGLDGGVMVTASHNPSDFNKTPEISVTELTPPYSDILAEADSGEVVPPFRLPAPSGNTLDDKFAVVQVTLRRAEGAVMYEDVKEQIRQTLGREMAVQEYLDTLQAGTYISIIEP